MYGRKMKMKSVRRSAAGQAIVEYVIIIAIVAIAAIAVLGVFSDRVREMIAGMASSLGSDNASEKVENSSTDVMKELDKDGIDF